MNKVTISLGLLISTTISVNSQTSVPGGNPPQGCPCCSNPANKVASLQFSIGNHPGLFSGGSWVDVLAPAGLKAGHMVSVSYAVINPAADLSKCCVSFSLIAGPNAQDRANGLAISNVFQYNSACVAAGAREVCGTIPAAQHFYWSPSTMKQEPVDWYLKVGIGDVVCNTPCDTSIIDVWFQP